MPRTPLTAMGICGGSRELDRTASGSLLGVPGPGTAPSQERPGSWPCTTSLLSPLSKAALAVRQRNKMRITGSRDRDQRLSPQEGPLDASTPTPHCLDDETGAQRASAGPRAQQVTTNGETRTRPLTTRYPVWVPPHPTPPARLWQRNSARGGEAVCCPKPYPVCHGIAEDHVLNVPAVFACAESAGSHIHSHGECQAPPVPNHPVNARHVRWWKDTWGRPHFTACPPQTLRPAPPRRLECQLILAETPAHTAHGPPCPRRHVKERVSPTPSALPLGPLSRLSGLQEHWKLHFALAAGIPRRG